MLKTEQDSLQFLWVKTPWLSPWIMFHKGCTYNEAEKPGTGTQQQQSPGAVEPECNPSCIGCYLIVPTISAGDLANRQTWSAGRRGPWSPSQMPILLLRKSIVPQTPEQPAFLSSWDEDRHKWGTTRSTTVERRPDSFMTGDTRGSPRITQGNALAQKSVQCRTNLRILRKFTSLSGHQPLWPLQWVFWFLLQNTDSIKSPQGLPQCKWGLLRWPCTKTLNIRLFPLEKSCFICWASVKVFFQRANYIGYFSG